MLTFSVTEKKQSDSSFRSLTPNFMPISYTLLQRGFKAFFSTAKERLLDKVLEVSPGLPHLLPGPLTFTHLLPPVPSQTPSLP